MMVMANGMKLTPRLAAMERAMGNIRATAAACAIKLDINIMLGASYSFISPTGYQTNLMVYGPGGYKFTDFFKIGIPLTILVGIFTVFLTPIFFKF